MLLEEKRVDLFTVSKDYYLAHCISCDAAMGAGIATIFAKKFPKIKALRNRRNNVGECILVDNVFNLITKRVYHGKPTYESLATALVSLKMQCLEKDITKLAMPKIGCGLDKLSWGKVRSILEDVFKDTDISILVCYL